MSNFLIDGKSSNDARGPKMLKIVVTKILNKLTVVFFSKDFEKLNKDFVKIKPPK